MSDQTDLSGESEPEERMQEIDRQNRERLADELDNERESDYNGEMTTDEFDIGEALESV